MNVPPPLVFDFLRVFARAEFALKGIQRFCLGAEGDNAAANWDRFASDIAAQLAAAHELDVRTKAVLLVDPPMKEVVRAGIAVFESAPLTGNEGMQLLHAVRRVRNNLFHGAKEHAERYRGHDEQLVTAARDVILVAIECHPDVRWRFSP